MTTSQTPAQPKLKDKNQFPNTYKKQPKQPSSQHPSPKPLKTTSCECPTPYTPNTANHPHDYLTPSPPHHTSHLHSTQHHILRHTNTHSHITPPTLSPDSPPFIPSDHTPSPNTRCTHTHPACTHSEPSLKNTTPHKDHTHTDTHKDNAHTSTPTHHTPTDKDTIHKKSPLYPFANTREHERPTDPPLPTQPHPPPLDILKVLDNPLLSNTRPADPLVHSAFTLAEPCPCHCKPLPYQTAGRSAHQTNRDLRKALNYDLRNSIDRPAYSSKPPLQHTPRADNLEDLMFSFPGIHDLDYTNPPPPIDSELNTTRWLYYHSRHCSNSPPCTPTHIADTCYFKPLHFMLHRGYQAHIKPGHSLHDIQPHPAAYIHLWQRDLTRCHKAFDKLINSTDLAPIDNPRFIFPLLPAYRKKHIWRFKKFGTDYSARITSDISTSGGNDIFSDWHVRYLGLHAVSRIVSRGDQLATRDATGFFNRLPAGEKLRMMQCFQDPRTYRSSSKANEKAIKEGKVKYLQQLSCMFGHKQLPAWASCVSSELARILHNECIRVIGILIDDFLFHIPASESSKTFQEQLDKTDEIMAELGVPANDKGQGPSTALVFQGILIDTILGLFSVDEEQREYIISRLKDILAKDHCLRKSLESVNGSLGWLCFVILHGRCRRDLIQKACNSDLKIIPISKALRKQLMWWLDILTRKAYRPSQIWFRNEIQKSLLIQSDASGEHGFGFCAGGLHVTGRWRESLAPVIDKDMFTKELLPVTIAILLIYILLPKHIFGSAVDNSGVSSRVNCGSCRSPLGRRLLTVTADALYESQSHIIADWNNREQPLARHADLLSKIFSTDQWSNIQQESGPPWIFDLFIQGGSPTQIFRTEIRIPRLAEAIPAHLRHRNIKS